MEADEKDVSLFSWSALFLVTAVCSLLFSGVLYLLDGRFSLFFPALSIVCLLFGLINRFVIYLKSPAKENGSPECIYRD